MYSLSTTNSRPVITHGTSGNAVTYALDDADMVMPARGRQPSPIYVEPDADSSSKVVQLKPRRGKRIVFGWYGGKFSHLDWLLPLLPKSHHYCEPFAGSAANLLNRAPSPVETYNDIDGDVANFFRILRDRADELIRLISLTPFSREEFHLAVSGNTKGVSDVERAHRFLSARVRLEPGWRKPHRSGAGPIAKTPAGPACQAWFRAGSVEWKAWKTSPSVCCASK